MEIIRECIENTYVIYAYYIWFSGAGEFLRLGRVYLFKWSNSFGYYGFPYSAVFSSLFVSHVAWCGWWVSGSLTITVPLWSHKISKQDFHFYRKLPSSLTHIPQFYSLQLMVLVFWHFVSYFHFRLILQSYLQRIHGHDWWSWISIFWQWRRCDKRGERRRERKEKKTSKNTFLPLFLMEKYWGVLILLTLLITGR